MIYTLIGPVVNRMVECATKVAKDMLGGSHVLSARVLNKFAKLRVGPGKIGQVMLTR